MPPATPTTRSTAPSLQRNLRAWGLLAGLMALGAMAGPLFAGMIYTRDDLGAFHVPLRAFYAERLARGEPFDWMPHLFSGFYLTGEGQVGPYHPWHLAIYRLLPISTALGWELLASYPLMMAGTYLLLARRLRRRDAAMFGALVFTLSGFNLLHFVHPNAIAVVAHIPWLLWAIDLAWTSPRRLVAAAATAAVALLTGSQILLGYPQYVWFSLVAEMACVAFLMRANRPPGVCESEAGSRPRIGNASICLQLAGAKAAGLLLGAVQLLPTADALLHSSRRAADASFSNWGSLHPANLLQVVGPYLLSHRVVGENTHEESLYLGAVPLVLLVWLYVRRHDLGRLRPLVLAATGLALVAVVMAFGQYGGLYEIQRRLPVIGSFRFPARYLVLVHLAVALLVSAGFMLLVRRCERRRVTPWSDLAPLGKVVAASAIAAAMGLILQGHEAIGPWPGVLAGPPLFGAAALLVALGARGSRRAIVGLVLVTAADLGFYGLSYAVYPGTWRPDEYAEAVLVPPDDRPGRVILDLCGVNDQVPRSGNQVVLAGAHRADGYAGLEPRRALDYRRVEALRAAGVRWVLHRPESEPIEGLAEGEGRWREVPDPVARFRLVTKVRTTLAPADDVAGLPLEEFALVERPLELGGGPPGRLEVVHNRPGRFVFQVDCPTRQMVAVSESFHPGWRASIDGRPAEVLRVNGDFFGCVVEPGKHRVVFEFRPRSLQYGTILSWLGVAATGVCFAIGMRTRRAHANVLPPDSET